MAQVRCPICERFFDPDQSRALPFCSPRCKLIDLGRWLEEDYGLAYEGEEQDRPREPGVEGSETGEG
jgi:uncharacterized protein